MVHTHKLGVLCTPVAHSFLVLIADIADGNLKRVRKGHVLAAWLHLTEPYAERRWCTDAVLVPLLLHEHEEGHTGRQQLNLMAGVAWAVRCF